MNRVGRVGERFSTVGNHLRRHVDRGYGFVREMDKLYGTSGNVLFRRESESGSSKIVLLLRTPMSSPNSPHDDSAGRIGQYLRPDDNLARPLCPIAVRELEKGIRPVRVLM